MILNNFVVFEGIDGAGTSTQMRLLAERDSGKKIAFTAEPTERPTGKFLRQILAGKEKVSAQTAAYLLPRTGRNTFGAKAELLTKLKTA